MKLNCTLGGAGSCSTILALHVVVVVVGLGGGGVQLGGWLNVTLCAKHQLQFIESRCQHLLSPGRLAFLLLVLWRSADVSKKKATLISCDCAAGVMKSSPVPLFSRRNCTCHALCGKLSARSAYLLYCHFLNMSSWSPAEYQTGWFSIPSLMLTSPGLFAPSTLVCNTTDLFIWAQLQMPLLFQLASLLLIVQSYAHTCPSALDLNRCFHRVIGCWRAL